MSRRLFAAVVAALTLAAVSCGGRFFGKQYEYEEDLTLGLDGTATLVVNASLASLSALRGLDLPADDTTRLDRERVRTLFTTPLTEVTRVSRPWRRKNRRFIQIRMRVHDIRRLHEAPPFAWSKYALVEENGKHVYTQVVGPSAMKPGSLQNYGWEGGEIVAFRLHLPSRIIFHNARDLERNEPTQEQRGNILAWEQHLADRLDGRPVEIRVEMESRSILRRTLWLFAGAFAAALVVLAALIWWTVRKGRDPSSRLSVGP